jgi:hypothetical protein
MPRLAGLDAPGILHHIMGRGIERKEIFINDTDLSDYIDRLAALVEEDAAYFTPESQPAFRRPAPSAFCAAPRRVLWRPWHGDEF